MSIEDKIDGLSKDLSVKLDEILRRIAVLSVKKRVIQSETYNWRWIIVSALIIYVFGILSGWIIRSIVG